MSSDLKPPIILFGNTRSGTTVVQKIICVHPGVVEWYEPNTLWRYADPGRGHDEYEEADATDKVKSYVRSQFLKYQKQNGNRIVLEKSPHNILRIPYVRAIFPEAKYLYIMRNPFSFISSVELKWQRPVTGKGAFRRLRETPITQIHHYVAKFISQQYDKRVLKRKYLSTWGPRYKGMAEDLKTLDMLTIISRQWSKASIKAEKDLAIFRQGEVLRLRYEDFVENPISDMERICAHCGLKMTDEMIKAAKETVKSDRKLKWQRFDPQDLAQIIPEIESEMQRHGYEIPAEISEAIGKLRNVEGSPMTPMSDAGEA